MLIDDYHKNLPDYYDRVYLDVFALCSSSKYIAWEIGSAGLPLFLSLLDLWQACDPKSKPHFTGEWPTHTVLLWPWFLFSRNIPPPPTARKYFGTILEHSHRKEVARNIPQCN